MGSSEFSYGSFPMLNGHNASDVAGLDPHTTYGNSALLLMAAFAAAKLPSAPVRSARRPLESPLPAGARSTCRLDMSLWPKAIVQQALTLFTDGMVGLLHPSGAAERADCSSITVGFPGRTNKC